ncbi:MAG: AAA family ATPase, partial [Oscillospiraceae bacterium]|nr:AAA family ATPase [Oscillospiraceae bacterium]
MNKISSFTVTAITMQGFKNFAEPQSFTFGGMNSITGHNGKGKTTVAEAIAYAITGVPLFGEASLDRLYTLEQQRDLRVELTLDTPDGTHTLIRARRNDETTVTYDGITLRQSDLAVMFGEKDVFLSIFNPLYFIEVLGDKGRNLLERYLPAIPQETVLARLSEPTRALLANEQLNAPEAYLERVRAELRELENSVIYTEGQRDMLGA